MQKWKLAAFAVGLSALAVFPALAQDTLDSSLEANFATFNWADRFNVDPYILTMVSGGNIDVSRLNLAPGCGGAVTAEPDMKFDWSGDSPLRLFFAAEGDTTLIIEQPDGTYVCNDDGPGYALNPVVDITDAQSGTYSVWVGTYGGANNYIPGYLFVTQGNYLPGAIDLPFLAGNGSTGTQGNTPNTPATTTGNTTSPSSDTLVLDGEGVFGTSDLAANFSPDPVTVNVTSGDQLDVFGQGIGTGCRGYVRGEPDYTVNWTGNSDLLRFFFVDGGTVDSTLIVHTPANDFVCGDDAGGGNLNPIVDIQSPEAGTYQVWVGNYQQGNAADGTLFITQDAALNPTNAR